MKFILTRLLRRTEAITFEPRQPEPRRLNISRLIPSIRNAAKKMSHSELALALEMAEWDVELASGLRSELAKLKVGLIRAELKARAATHEPHPVFD